MERQFGGFWGDVCRWENRARAQGWIGRNRGRDNSAARQLLAVRASWELVLRRALGLARDGRDEALEFWYA